MIRWSRLAAAVPLLLLLLLEGVWGPCLGQERRPLDVLKATDWGWHSVGNSALQAGSASLKVFGRLSSMFFGPRRCASPVCSASRFSISAKSCILLQIS